MMLRWLVFIFAVFAAGSAGAGVLRTLDDQKYEGDLRIADGAVVVREAGGTERSVALKDVFSACFSAMGKSPSTQPGEGDLPAPWQARDVGAIGPAGKTSFTNGAFVIGGGGDDWPAASACHFVYQKLRGDGHLIARLNDLGGAGMATAAIVFRESLAVNSPLVMARAGHYRSISMQWRTAGGKLRNIGHLQLSFPIWLRLVREGNRISGYHSDDGSNWELFGATELPMGEEILVGLAVAGNGRKTQRLAVAGFDHVRLIRGRGPLLWRAGTDDPRLDPEMPVLKSGVVLRNGCVLPGRIESLSFDGVKIIDGSGKARSLALDEVARVAFAPMPAGVEYTIPPKGAGALLPDGDFFAGELRSIRNRRITLNSILLGTKSFEMGRQIAALCLRGVERAEAGYELRLRDGSVLLGKELRLGAGWAEIDDLVRGRLRVQATDIYELRAIHHETDAAVR